jgi:hypothetical protein
LAISVSSGEEAMFNTWDGAHLETTVRAGQMAFKEAGIKTGADYGRAWVANAFRYPFAQLPYLFAWGPENSGKSIFHEALQELVTKGVVKADKAITSHNDFNGELAGAVICAVEEKDISKSPGAHAKVKEYTTGLTTDNWSATTSRILSLKRQ